MFLREDTQNYGHGFDGLWFDSCDYRILFKIHKSIEGEMMYHLATLPFLY